MKFWETHHVHSNPWPNVAAGYWNRYPNPYSSHVYSVDTLETKVVDGKLYCRRLIMKTNSVPSWGRHFFTATRVPVIEECVVDPAQQKLTWYVRNIGLSKFMATVEKATVSPHPTRGGHTAVIKQVWIDSSIVGFRSAIRKFGIDRYKKNCVLATQGFQTVLDSLHLTSGTTLHQEDTAHIDTTGSDISAAPSSKKPTKRDNNASVPRLPVSLVNCSFRSI